MPKRCNPSAGQLKRPATLATAVFYGDLRLIDHVTLLP
jgi:pantoate--beta-alanine ligase